MYWRRAIGGAMALSVALVMPAWAAEPGSAALLQAAQAAQERGDEASAFSLLRRLAIADDPEGQHRLGLLLEQPQSRVQPDPEEAAYWYWRAAEQGHAGAAKRLGDLYAVGTVGSFQSLGRQAPHLGEAVRWYRQAAAQGDAEAEAALRGLAARQPLVQALLTRAAGDHAGARAQLEALAARRDLEALYWRGVMQEAGEGGPPDPAGAVRWYEQGYQSGFGPAALALGRLYEEGRGVARSIDQAYRMYSAAGARPGSAGDAQVAIQRLGYLRRFGGPPAATVDGALSAISSGSELLAASILLPLARAGDPDAQYWLATTYQGERNEAIRWYRAAALQGDSEAAYQLALLLDGGLDRAGRPLADAAEKARWLRRAAEAGHHDAALSLGEAYRSGKGVALSQAEAERWYKAAHRAEEGWSRLTRPDCVEDETAPELLPAFLACNRGDGTGLAAAIVPLAEAGNARAQAWLAYLLAGGPGITGGYDLRARANAQKAARWYRKAAEQGLPSAMHDYAVLLEHGLGVPVDEAAAAQWHAKAEAAGFPRAARP